MVRIPFLLAIAGIAMLFDADVTSALSDDAQPAAAVPQQTSSPADVAQKPAALDHR